MDKKVNVKAVLSLVLGGVSILCSCLWAFSLMLAIAGAVLGILAIREESVQNAQKDLAICGIVISSTGLALSVSSAIIYIVMYGQIADYGIK